MKAKDLSEVQLAIMRVIWTQHEVTVQDVVTALQPERKLALTSVSTMLQRLEKYGFLTHRKKGRQFIYRALVSQNEVEQTMVSGFIKRLFDGSSASLVAHLLRENEIDSNELDEIQNLIDARRDDT